MTITLLTAILFIATSEGGNLTEVARFETMAQCQAAAATKWEPYMGGYFRVACVDTKVAVGERAQ